MNDVIVKPELEEEDDEENGRITPKRMSVRDYEVAGSPVTMDHNKTENNTSSVEVMQPHILDNVEAMQTFLNEDLPIAEHLQNSDSMEALLASSISTIGVLVKDEPQDTDIAAVETPVCSLGSQLNAMKNDTEMTPPLTPPAIPTSPRQRTPATDLIDNTETQVHISAMEPHNSHSPGAVNSTIESTTTPVQSQISVVSTHRLRVKMEFSETAASSSHECPVLPQDFFADLLPVNAPPPPVIKDEPIPDNFFDDLLVDRAKERVETAETVELEEKFSDRLRLLRDLDERVRTKDKKRHKHSKKKSRKRRRSRSRSRNSRSPTPKHMRNKRERDEISNSPSTSHRARSKKHNSMEKSSPVSDDEPQRELTSAADIELVDEMENIEAVQPHLPEIGPHLTAKQKRDRIMIRAKSLIAYLRRVENAEETPFSTFLYTSTVRKLPASHSYRSQHIYENRSPLHTINNVSYKFNSHASQFNFEEWGLASLPPVSAKIAKLVGYDAAAVHNKLKVIKIPAKVRNIKCTDGNGEEEEEELLRTGSMLFCNATTQTDEMVEIIPRKTRGYDIGIQVQPASFEIACQTLETESPSIKKFDNNDDLPIMILMRELNENQLIALHDFAELVKEPATNAMDMYRLRQRMLDIYKCSQMASALAAPVPASGNSYTSNERSSTDGYQQQQQHQEPTLRIQTVCSADGQRYSATDPRIRSRGMANNLAIRNVSPGSQSKDCYDPRSPSFSQRPPGPTHQPQNTYSYQMQHQQQRSQPPTNNANKYYGRGGLRR